MAKKKLYKSKTNFTLKRMHQSGSYGKIFERDYSTISKTTSPEGQIPIYSSPTFKMTVNGGYNGQKKYRYGEWLSNPNSCGNNNTSWTLDCMPYPNKNDNKIVLKSNSKRLTDFVCYSSALEFIKASVSDIIFKFPGELYVTNNTLDSTGIFSNNILNENSWLWKHREQMKNYYLVDNPLLIDIIQGAIPENTNLPNLKFFCKSFKEYEFIDENNEKEEIIYWDVTPEESKDCIVNGDKLATVTLYKETNNDNVLSEGDDELIKIHCFNVNKEVIYVSNKRGRIRPNKEKINDFFYNLDDFQKILLNQYTDYTATFETYEEDDENGWYYVEKKYQWPTTEGDWNIAVQGFSYNNYIDKLSELAYGYDELYTNAIWRMMTHEAISNMDLTIYKNGENLNPNSSKLKKMLNIIGRQFDEIKKYADNIKNNNNITYEQEKNAPDYFLTDNLDLSGWEVKEILNEVPDDEITEPMYAARTLGFTANDANNEFIRRLKLNSRNILAKKGTKQAIEDLLGVFGFHSTDWLKRYYNGLKYKHLRNAYVIVEKVYIANGYGYKNTAEETLENVKRLNQLKDNFNIDGIENEYGIDEFQGIPVTEASIGDKSRLIPWFDRDKEYDSKIYFQSKGGWSRNTGSEGYVLYSNEKPDDIIDNGNAIKVASLPENKLEDYIYILYNDNYYIWEEKQGEYVLYSEEMPSQTPENVVFNNVYNVTSLPCLKLVNYKYILFENNYYIWDNIKTNGYYEQTISNINYVATINDLYELPFFVLKEKELYYVGDEKKYYKIYDINNHGKPEGWVIVNDPNEILKFENTIDSNKGNNPHAGDYDGGENYLDAFQKIFEKSEFNNSRNDETEGYISYGFDIKILPDSNKCLYFNENQKSITFSDNLRGSRLKPYNFFNEEDENGEEESAALSIINSKELHITFDISNQEFIEKDVLPYLKQLIPSTTIFSYSFEFLESDDDIFEAMIEDKICDNNSCHLLGVVDNN